jgi:hypothetical protein
VALSGAIAMLVMGVVIAIKPGPVKRKDPLRSVGSYPVLPTMSFGRIDFAPEEIRETTYVYHIPCAVPPQFLTDDAARFMASAAVKAYRLNSDEWAIVQQTNRQDNVAPDGSRDGTLVRTPSGDPNHGYLILQNRLLDEHQRFVVNIWLESNQLSAAISMGRLEK